MNIIMTIFEEFLDILGLTSKRRANQDAQNRAQKAYKLAFKEGYNKGYIDASNGEPNKYSPQRKIAPIMQKCDILVLFVKAERGSTLIDVIRNNKNISGISSDQLVSCVFRIWAGSEKQYDESEIKKVFSYPNETSNVGKEYDSVAIALPYPQNASSITKDSDSYTIAEVVRTAVNQGLACINISNRVPFSRIENLPLREI